MEAASLPIRQLGQVVWNRCFQGKPGTDTLLAAAANGSEPELKQIHAYLLKEMENPAVVEMVKPIAEEIDDYVYLRLYVGKHQQDLQDQIQTVLNQLPWCKKGYVQLCTISGVRIAIAISSGKGGVSKSTTAFSRSLTECRALTERS